MNSMKQIVLIFVALLIATPLNATIRNVPGQYARIQTAVDFANDGDTILLAPNTYTGEGNRKILVLNKGLTIMGAGDPALVVISPDDSNHYRAFAVINPTSLMKFENLTIYRATTWGNDSLYRHRGGGILSVNANLSVNNCRFIRAVSYEDGGAICAVGSTIEVSNSAFDTCGIGDGGAIYCDSASTCLVTSSSFTRCTADRIAGAILVEGATSEISNCEFSDNVAFTGLTALEGYGGAVAVTRGGSLQVSACRFVRNYTYDYGGAVYSASSNLAVSNSLFEDNYVSCNMTELGPPILGDGGALYASGGSCIIDSSTFVGNWTRCGRSAVYISASLATVNQCIIAASDSAVAFTGSADFICTDMFGNSLGDWTGSIASQLGQNGNISADPLFCSAFPGDYRIDAASPCAPENNTCNQRMGSELVGCDMICGDADFSGFVSISDAVYLVQYIFASGAPPPTTTVGDVDCNSLVTISDVVYLINYIFSSGPTPCAACP